MRARDIAGSIGKIVRINGARDLAMRGDMKALIGRDCVLIKQCKNGLVEVTFDDARYSVPLRNVDPVDAADKTGEKGSDGNG